MKLFKRIFTATVIFLIVISIAGIIYVLQFQEEPSVIKEPKKETKQIKTEKGDPKFKGKTLAYYIGTIT